MRGQIAQRKRGQPSVRIEQVSKVQDLLFAACEEDEQLKLDKSECGEKCREDFDGGRCTLRLSDKVNGSDQEDALAQQTENRQQELCQIKSYTPQSLRKSRGIPS